MQSCNTSNLSFLLENRLFSDVYTKIGSNIDVARKFETYKLKGGGVCVALLENK